MQFADFISCGFDQIVNQAATLRYRYGGRASVPIVVRAPSGGNVGGGLYHSQNPEAWFIHRPGLKVVAASTPQDAYGLMRSAINDPNPVIYLEHKKLLGNSGPLDTSEGAIPLGKARVVRSGDDVTLVASLAMVPVALEAAERLSSDGVDATVIDIRCLLPFDADTIVDSVRQTGRLVTIEEQPIYGGWGSSVVAEVVDKAFDYLDHPPLRVGTPAAPIAFSPVLEDMAIPSVERTVEAVKTVMGR